ncbi:sodium ion-translocating decarboxylase subunit beta [Salmonella enterica subsp. enterica]|nr:sodium ion-translocating decarboxylase subunit beta [Salmonella enterica subsp. enterica]
MTIFTGLSVGAKRLADGSCNRERWGYWCWGDCVWYRHRRRGADGTASVNVFRQHKINPLIGSAGIVTVPIGGAGLQQSGAGSMRRTSCRLYAMGPNVAGVIGSAIAAGVMLRGSTRAGDVIADGVHMSLSHFHQIFLKKVKV